MADKLYVDSVAEMVEAERDVVTLMTLSAEDAARKSEIHARFAHAVFDLALIRDGLHPALDLRVRCVRIQGPSAQYILPKDQYRVGQVLDALPVGAIPAYAWRYQKAPN